MSQVIDTKVVEMQFDNSKFEKNIEVSLNSLKNLNKSIRDTEGDKNSLDGLANAGEKVARSFDNVQSKARLSFSAIDIFSGVATKAFNRVTDAIAEFTLSIAKALTGIQAMKDGFNEYELKMGSVQTILMGAKILDPETGKEIKDDAARLAQINEQLKALNDYSDKTIYSFKDMTSNIGKFTNAGIDLKTSVGAIQGVANVAALAGANSNDASRAMYNFSQALSSGEVKLVDWKSIENANMATVDFKQQLINTALAMGKLKREAPGVTRYIAEYDGKISDVFSSTEKFNDTLQYKWLSSDVLTKTLQNYSTDVRYMTDNELQDYIKDLREFGYTQNQVNRIIEDSRKAFKAATEVKTFTQLKDTIKESIGSGWAETFEIIIGDFTEAKELWTDVNVAIDKLISPLAKARNEMLGIWKTEGGRDALIKSFANLYHIVENLLEPLHKVWDAFTPNRNTVGVGLANALKKFEAFTEEIRAKSMVWSELITKHMKPVIDFGHMLGQAIIGKKGLGAFEVAYPKAVKSIRAIRDTIKVLYTAVKNVIVRIRDSVSKSVNDIKTRLDNSESFKNLMSAFKDLGIAVRDLFENTIWHSANYAQRFVDYLGAMWNALSPLISLASSKILPKLSDIILPKIRKALEWLTARVLSLKNAIGSVDFSNSRFYKTLAGLPEKISEIANSEKLKSIFTTIEEFGSDALSFLSDKFGKFKDTLESIKMPGGLSDLFDKIKDFIKSIFGAESVGEQIESSEATGPIKDIADEVEKAATPLTNFQKFLQNISTVFEWLKRAAEDAFGAIKTFVKFIVDNTPKALNAFYKFLAGDDGVLTLQDLTYAFYDISEGIGTIAAGFGFDKLGDAAKGAVASFGDISEAVVKFLKRSANKAQMSALKDFAIAIGIVAGALFLLSHLDTKKLLVAASVITALGFALSKFFGMLSSGNFNALAIGGNLSIATILIGIGAAMIGIAVSVGILVGALALFPIVIKSYNNLGEEFSTGMKRVKEVLEEIFSYLDHSKMAKYSLESSLGLFFLVSALNRIRKTIVEFASEETGNAMEEGLKRIQKVMGILSTFLNSTALASFTGINIGINFNTIGVAAMIWAIGDMIKKISGPLQTIASSDISKYDEATKILGKVMGMISGFMIAMTILSKSGSIKSSGNKIGKVGNSLGGWIGVSLTIMSIASAISSAVSSLSTLANLATTNPEGLSTAITILTGVFIALSGLLMVIGAMENKVKLGSLFGLTVAIGILTACVVALSPIAMADPKALVISVVALGALMIGLGKSLQYASQASGKSTIKDIVKIIAITGAMLVLVNAIRRLARSGASTGELVASAAALGVAAGSIAGAMYVLGKIKGIPTSVIVGLFALAAVLWVVAYAIGAFRNSVGGLSDGADIANEASAKLGDAFSNIDTSKMAASAKDILPEFLKDLFGDLGPKIKEFIGNFNLGEHIRNAIEAVKASAKSWAQDFLDIGFNIIEGLTTAISDPANAQRLLGAVGGLVKGIIQGFKNLLGISSPSKVMAELGGFIIDGLVQGLMEFPGKVGEWLKSIGSFILDGISGFFAGAVEKGRGLIDSIGTGIQNGKEFVVTKAKSLGKAALDKVGKAKEWGARALSSASAYGEKLRASKNPLKKAAGFMIGGATTYLSTIGKTFGTFASTAASTFAAQIRAGKNPVYAAGVALLSGAKSAFSGIYSSFLTFGKNAAEGFRSGISSLISSVANKAREMVREAKEAAKNEQHSQSPSKDFMKFGGWAAEGYALGMTNRRSTRLVKTNAEKMIDAAKNAVSSTSLNFGPFGIDSNPAVNSLAYAMSQISDNLDGSLDASPTIRPVIDMSDVNRGVSFINSIFGDQRMGATLATTGKAQNDFNRIMANRANAMSTASIDKLTKKIDGMTTAMNSRSLNVYNTFDGTSNPGAFADELIRNFRLNARTL